MILHQIASRLANIFNRYSFDPLSASAEAQPIIEELYQSLGGCDLCAGKGYTIHIEYCTCPRGVALQGFVANRSAMPPTHLSDKKFEEV